jgi:hypothetical protein
MKTPPYLLFYSYAHEDERLRINLGKQMILLEREGLISAWHDRKIVRTAHPPSRSSAVIQSTSRAFSENLSRRAAIWCSTKRTSSALARRGLKL